MNETLVDLTTRLLQLSPSRRLSAKDALQHAYFETTLVPRKKDTWLGEPRVDVSDRCVEAKGGKCLVDHLADQLEAKRTTWSHQ
jgi:hypothetical protein